MALAPGPPDEAIGNQEAGRNYHQARPRQEDPVAQAGVLAAQTVSDGQVIQNAVPVWDIALL